MNEARTEPLPFLDPKLLEHLDQLAKRAGRIYQDADLVARSMARATGKNDPFLYLKELKRDPVLWVSCGAFKISPSDERLTFFWDSVRTLVAAQFSGFPAGSQDSITKILHKVDTPFGGFWTLPPRPSADGEFPVFARLFALLSICSAVLPRVEELEQPATDRALSFVTKLLTSVVKHHVPWLIEYHSEYLLWPVTLLKLAENVYNMMIKLHSKYLVGPLIRQVKYLGKAFELERKLRAKLRNQFKLDLASQKLTPLEVSDIVGVLGGRYLNPTLQIEPVDQELYTQAARYILGKCGDEGSWEMEYFHEKYEKYPVLKDPLLGRFSPLAFLLDLPNPVLMPCISELAKATADALSTLERRLGGYKIQLPLEQDEREKLVKNVYNSLMVGAAVSDRLKDLLSDAELDRLQAEVPDKTVEWDRLSDSLGFKDSLERGVIQLWKTRNPARPGAILVFGPPGTGKTTIAKSLLAKLNKELRGVPGPSDEWRFLALSPADFAREGANNVIALAERMFQRLQRVRRCVVLLDEMEEFLRARGPNANRESSLITTAFLPLLQETVDRREIILIVATNFVGNIDRAVTRRGRFDLILPLGPPGIDSRREIIAAELEQLSKSVSRSVIEDVVKYTMGYTRDEIRDYVKELKNSPEFPEGSALICELWRIRQERVPMALSGNPGCNWRTFRDEAARFKRSAVGMENRKPSVKTAPKRSRIGIMQESPQDYWIEPELPKFKRPRRPLTKARGISS